MTCISGAEFRHEPYGIKSSPLAASELVLPLGGRRPIDNTVFASLPSPSIAQRSTAAMSKYSAASASQIPTIIPPQAAESKRDRKRRETVNKIEMLHNGSWNNRDE